MAARVAHGVAVETWEKLGQKLAPKFNPCNFNPCISTSYRSGKTPCFAGLLNQSLFVKEAPMFLQEANREIPGKNRHFRNQEGNREIPVKGEGGTSGNPSQEADQSPEIMPSRSHTSTRSVLRPVGRWYTLLVLRGCVSRGGDLASTSAVPMARSPLETDNPVSFRLLLV